MTGRASPLVLLALAWAAVAAAPPPAADLSLLATQASGSAGDFPVDLVYTYVNGTDPKWLDIRNSVSVGGEKGVANDAQTPLRFRDHDELRYSLRSVAQNAPWVNHIYIVVCCRQRPSWLANTDKVTIVQHEEIFPPGKSVLPTFNSFAIECAVDNIPRVKEHFLLMNDDMMFSAPVEKSDFFDNQGRPRIGFQENWSDMPKNSPADDADAYTWACHNVDTALDQKYGVESRKRVLHQAYPMTKELYSRAHEVFADQFKSTFMHQLRAKTDIMPHFLAAWMGIYEQKAVKLTSAATPSNIVIQMSDDVGANSAIFEQVMANPVKLLCVGDKSKDPAAHEAIEMQYKKYLGSIFPDKSPYEK